MPCSQPIADLQSAAHLTHTHAEKHVVAATGNDYTHVNISVATKGHQSHTHALKSVWLNLRFTPFASHNRHDTVTFVLSWKQGKPEVGTRMFSCGSEDRRIAHQ